MQQRLVKTIPSTVVTSIVVPTNPSSELSHEEQRLLAAVAECHKDALELRRNRLSLAERNTPVQLSMALPAAP